MLTLSALMQLTVLVMCVMEYFCLIVLVRPQVLLLGPVQSCLSTASEMSRCVDVQMLECQTDPLVLCVGRMDGRWITIRWSVGLTARGAAVFLSVTVRTLQLSLFILMLNMLSVS